MPIDFGTLPQQVTAISTGGIFLALVSHLIKWNLGRGRLALDEQTQHNLDEANIRDHYAKEVERLTERLEKSDERYRKLLEEAEAERDKMRKRINFLEDEVKGLVRLITYNSANNVLLLGEDVPADIRAAAERVRDILRNSAA